MLKKCEQTLSAAIFLQAIQQDRKKVLCMIKIIWGRGAYFRLRGANSNVVGARVIGGSGLKCIPMYQTQCIVLYLIRLIITVEMN